MMSNLYQLSPVFHRTKASDIGVVDSMAFAKAHMHKFSVPLPDGVDYHFPGGEGAEPVTVSFAAWMLKDGNGGYKALEDPVTSKAVKPAVETEKVKRRKVLITAAFRSEMADEYALNDENGNPRYAVRLHASRETMSNRATIFFICRASSTVDHADDRSVFRDLRALGDLLADFLDG